MDRLGMKQYMDFILKEANTYSKGLVFRFYPSASHMHGFRDKPPKDFEDVYKVYYSWAIIEGEGENSGFVPMFVMMCDECSVLFGLEDTVRYYTDHVDDLVYKKYCLMSPGQPGSIWEIQRQKRDYFDGEKWVESPEHDAIQFSVWNNLNNKGYRFYLTLGKADKFADYIEDVNRYMLEFGEPI